MILRFSTPPRHRLFFQPCAEPNPENGRIWSPRRVRANTTRLDLGIACALNPTPAIRRKSPAQIEPDSREALHPAPPAPAAASQAVALGHPPARLSVCLSVRQEKGGLPKACAPVPAVDYCLARTLGRL